jgi:hypothetical protein
MCHLLVHLVFYHRYIEIVLYPVLANTATFLYQKKRQTDIKKRRRRLGGIAFKKVLINQSSQGILYSILYMSIIIININAIIFHYIHV